MLKHPLYLLILVSALITGCTTPTITLQPVHHDTSAPVPGVYDLNLLAEQPVAIYKEAPFYPRDLKKAGVSGTALVQCVIDENGAVVDVLVVEATDIRFGNAAAAATQKWRFRPAKVGGHAVKCRLHLPWKFDIED